MTKFYGYAKWRLSNGTYSRTNLFLGDFSAFDPGLFESPFAEAVDAATQIFTAQAACTNAVLAEYGVRHVIDEEGGFPTEAAEIHDRALIECYLEDDPITGDPSKTWTLEIVAPKVDIFQGLIGEAYDTVDISDATVIQVVQQYAQHTTVSDGERVDEGKGSNGILKGYRKYKRRR